MRPNLTTLRSFVNSTLTAGCTITVAGTGPPVFNDDTGTYDPPPSETLYTGKVLLYPQDRSREAVAGEADFHISRYTVILPADAAVRVGATLTVTSSPDAPPLLGEKFTIVDAPVSALLVGRECVAENVTP